MSTIHILSAETVSQVLPMPQAIDAMRAAFAQFSAGKVVMPPRSHLQLPKHNGTLLVMPAYLPASAETAVKIVSIYPQQRPVVNASVLVVDAETGQLTALIDGTTLTAIRTGAAGGLSADLLALKSASALAILGSGVQARAGLEAVCAVRPIRQVRVYSPNRQHAADFAAQHAGRGDLPADIHAVSSSAEAVRGADIIYAATTSSTPVFDGRLLKAGAHVIGVGSFTPQMCEVDAETVRRARVVVDSRVAAMAEAGELIQALAKGVVSAEHIQLEIGQIINGTHAGRTHPDQITFFKSVGIAAQDAAAAHLALRNARRLNLGQTATL